MKKLPIALAVTAITAGSAHAAVIYSSEDFEGGTVNYTGTTLVAGSTPAGALTGTDYYPRATSRMGITAQDDPAGYPGEPTGQHGFISTSANRIMALGVLMPLVTDGVQSVDVSFTYMMHGFDAVGAVGSFELTYSASGNFDDQVRIATIGFGQAGSTVVTPDYLTAQENNWYDLTLSFDAGDVGGAFTNTGSIGFNRIALISGGTTGVTTTNQYVYLDDITVTGQVPEPTTTALCGLAGFALLLRRRK